MLSKMIIGIGWWILQRNEKNRRRDTKSPHNQLSRRISSRFLL